jgi:hypothetical protein
VHFFGIHDNVASKLFQEKSVYFLAIRRKLKQVQIRGNDKPVDTLLCLIKSDDMEVLLFGHPGFATPNGSPQIVI